MPVINQAKNRAGLHAGRVKGNLWRQNKFGEKSANQPQV
jgi:hypothetical protein